MGKASSYSLFNHCRFTYFNNGRRIYFLGGGGAPMSNDSMIISMKTGYKGLQLNTKPELHDGSLVFVTFMTEFPLTDVREVKSK
jgi:hypothetical protein